MGKTDKTGKKAKTAKATKAESKGKKASQGDTAKQTPEAERDFDTLDADLGQAFAAEEQSGVAADGQDGIATGADTGKGTEEGLIEGLADALGDGPVEGFGADFGADLADNGGIGLGLTLEQALERLAAAETAAARAKDDLVRVKAEMQNLRRRTEQDIEKAHKFGQEKFSIELLSVIDNLERALAAAGDSDDEAVRAIHEGVSLTLKSFTDCFAKFNIETVDPVGEPFDPELHQAVTTQENAEVEPNTVVAVMQKGYTLHGRVIRPAMVMVSKAP